MKKPIVQSIAIAGVYFITARLGLKFGAISGFATLIWPPTGIALAALILIGNRLWIGVAAGAFLANWTHGASVPVAAGISAGNTLEAVVAAELLKRSHFDPSLTRLRSVFFLVIFAAFLSTLISATFGAISLLIGGGLTASFVATWRAWWIGDIMGDLVVAPVLLVLGSMHRSSNEPRRLLEAFCLGTLLLIIGVFVFTDWLARPGEATPFPRPYLAFPVLLLIALRFEQPGVVSSVFVISAVAIGTTITGHGRFWTGSLSQSLVEAQLFLGILAISKLVLAAAIAERRRHRTDLEATQQQLLSDYDDLKLLNELGATLLSPIEMGELLYRVLDTAISITHAPMGNIQLYDPNSNSLRIAAHRGFEEPFLKHIDEVDIGPAACGEAMRHKTRIIVEDVERSPIFMGTPTMAVMREAHIGAVQSTPLLGHGDALLGIFSTHWREPHVPSYRTLQLLDLLARKAASVIENRQHEMSLQVAKREAERALGERDEFLSIASHELKTPLTTLSIQLQMLEQNLKQVISGTKDSPEILSKIPLNRIERAVSICWAQAKKLASLLDDLLDLTRIRAGKLKLELQEIDFEKLVQESTERLLAGTDHARLVSLQLPGLSIIGKWDPLRIEQVITNLIGNAIKYGAGNPIEVKVSTEGTSAILIVKDYGLGIPREMQSKIFERFERAVGSTQITGLGLGLYISRQIVEAHGGSISVQSEVSRGSTFTVILPL